MPSTSSALVFALALALGGATACAHLAPRSFAEIELVEAADVQPAVLAALSAHEHRVSEVEPQRVVTGWATDREGATTHRERFIVTWEGEPPGPVTIFVRHERQKMQVDQGQTSPWSSPTHDMAAQQRLLEAITERLPAPAAAAE